MILVPVAVVKNIKSVVYINAEHEIIKTWVYINKDLGFSYSGIASFVLIRSVTV